MARSRRGGSRRVRKQDIVSHLRERIIAGDLKPGDRVPTQRQIECAFGTTPVTAQRAFTHLVAAGFIEVRSRRGRFVAARPPHANRIGMVFPDRPGGERWVGFWSGLARVAKEFNERDPREVVTFEGVTGRGPGSDRLAREIAERRLAGLFVPALYEGLHRRPPLEGANLPVVAVTRIPIPGAMRMVLDWSSFFRRAVDLLRERGRRRIALIAVPGTDVPLYERTMRARGLPCERRWTQLGLQYSPQWTRNLMHLVFDRAARERPDGLVISDDNLVGDACAGLEEAGVRVGAELDVIAHANFPLESAASLPILRLGFDAAEVLEGAVDAVAGARGARRGLTIRARLESELRPVARARSWALTR